MRTQIQSSLLITDKEFSLKDFPHGEIFSYHGEFLMKLNPTSFLLNYSLIGDVIDGGDCFVCNIETGTLYIMEGENTIDLIDATMCIKEL